VPIDSEEVVVTDEKFGEAEPLMAETTAAAEKIIGPELVRNHIPVMGGFIGRSLSGATTTLGRGGSDYSAAIIGAALRAEEVQIWTDVDGMLTCDPRIVPAARMIDVISYEEAAELAYFGAKVLHPKTIMPAVDLGIPIRVLNTHNPSSPGTLITAEGDGGSRGARSIALKRNITLVHVVSNKMLGAHGFLARIFEVFNRHSVSVDLITTSEVSVTLSIDSDERLEKVIAELESVANVRVAPNQTIVAVVGRNLLDDPTVGTRIFEALGGRKTSMISYGLTRLNMSVVLDGVDPDEAVRTLHRALFEN
jgi:aspartate kinase